MGESMKPTPITAREVAETLVAQEHLAWSSMLLLRYSPSECVVRSPERAYLPRGPVARVARQFGNSIQLALGMYANVALGWFVRKRHHVAADALLFSLRDVEDEANWGLRAPDFAGVWLAVGPRCATSAEASVLMAERVYLEDGPGVRIVVAWEGEVLDAQRIGRRLVVSFADGSAAWLRARIGPATWFETAELP
jgi:hypothetical protein